MTTHIYNIHYIHNGYSSSSNCVMIHCVNIRLSQRFQSVGQLLQ